MLLPRPLLAGAIRPRAILPRPLRAALPGQRGRLLLAPLARLVGFLLELLVRVAVLAARAPSLAATLAGWLSRALGS